MTISILLLDCSDNLADLLERQGFNVSVGSMGFGEATRYLPNPLYENQIIIYNPKKIIYWQSQITDATPEYTLQPLAEHIKRGATVLAFVNPSGVDSDFVKLQNAYAWIPGIPNISPTKDHKVIAAGGLSNAWVEAEVYAPLIDVHELKIPVGAKLSFPNLPRPLSQNYPVVNFIFNMNKEPLAGLRRLGFGQVIILPEYKSNEDLISAFLHRVMPKLYKLDTKTSIRDEFISPPEIKADEEIESFQNQIKEAGMALQNAKEKREGLRRDKIKVIDGDPTCSQFLKYYDTSLNQPDVALFFLYKIVETIEDVLGGEREAKSKLNCAGEWNLIKKLSNETYRDIRHAPRPGEKAKEWTPDEIKKCFAAIEKIIESYFMTLFVEPRKENDAIL